MNMSMLILSLFYSDLILILNYNQFLQTCIVKITKSLLKRLTMLKGIHTY